MVRYELLAARVFRFSSNDETTLPVMNTGLSEIGLLDKMQHRDMGKQKRTSCYRHQDVLR